jgi:hypothetical protein
MTVEEAEIPTQFTHSVKISDTAKGIRLDVHVWANDMKTAVEGAFQTYQDARNTAAALDIALAPIEVKEK